MARTMRGTTDLPSAHLTFQTHFNRSWGLGSSSTLVHLVAQWLEVDAMALFRATDTGSGYDLATALEGKPIYYRLEKNQAHWKAVQVHWPFLDQLWLVPMGMKQKSDAEVKKFKERGPADPNLIRRISDLAARIAEAQTLAEFNDKLARHEAAVGALLGRPPIRQSLHVPPSMEVKSLGAWGGDLVLVTGAAHEVALFSQSNNLGKPQPFSEVVVI